MLKGSPRAKILLAVIFGFSLAHCNQSNGDKAVIEANIANKVKLPSEAQPSQQYSRYYARTGDDIVEVVYITHPQGWRSRVEEACKAGEISEYPCDQDDFGVADAGESIWVPDRIHLPGRNDGGCSQIYIRFNIEADEIEEIECSGFY